MELQSIFIYPIKGLGAVSLTECFVERRGLALDRRWMLVDEEGVFLSQRKVAKMATVGIEIGSDRLIAKHCHHGEVCFPFQGDGPKREVRVWRSEVEAVVQDPEVNKWFSDLLEIRCTLVRMPESTVRATNPDYSEPGDVVSFADGYPVTIATMSSLAELNASMEVSIPMSRFRPNLVTSDDIPAWDEDRWKRIKIGNVAFRSAKPCGRCIVTTIDQSSGVSSSEEPLTTLAKIRRFGTSLDFSINVIPENEESISIGMPIEILETYS